MQRLKEKQNAKQITKEDAVRVLKRFVPNTIYVLLSSHIHLLNVKKKGRRWSPEMKTFALNLYFHGPQAYRLVAEDIELPTVRSVKRWLSKIPMKPGIIPGVLTTIQNAVENWSTQDRVCSLLFDEVSINALLQYDAMHDTVIGFADDGINRTPRIANAAFVMVLSGISKSWIQPVAFVLAHSATAPRTIHTLLLDVIPKLQEVGVHIKAVICDQGSNNVAVSTLLKVSPEEPYFKISDQKIFFLFDTPHLVKCVRNNLRQHTLKIGPETVDWSHIVKLHESSHPLRPRLAPNVTDKHIYKTPFGDMNVSRAVQVLSATMSLGLLVLVSLNVLPASAKYTADFIDRMDKLFDSLNSSCVRKKGSKLRYAISESSEHVSFLRECLSWIDQWNFDSSRQPHTIRGLKITIKAVLLLWEELHVNYGFSHLLTRRLQQDPLENLFGIIRQQHGCNENPSVLQFVGGLKHIVLSKLMKLSRAGNCEQDTSLMLASLAIENDTDSNPTPTVPVQSLEAPGQSQGRAQLVTATAGNTSPVVEDNVLYYVAGCLVKDFVKNATNDCVCERFLKPEGAGTLGGAHQFFALLKAHDVPGELFGDITVPSDECFNCIQSMETSFLDNIGSMCHQQNVCKTLCNELKQEATIFCSPTCHKRFVRQYVHMRLKWHLRFVNRNLKALKSRHSAAARKARKLTQSRGPASGASNTGGSSSSRTC